MYGCVLVAGTRLLWCNQRCLFDCIASLLGYRGRVDRWRDGLQTNDQHLGIRKLVLQPRRVFFTGGLRHERYPIRWREA